MDFTNQDFGAWIFRLLGALICCIIVYSYIDYRVSLAKEKKAVKEKLLEPAPPAKNSQQPAPQSGTEILDLLLKQGFCIALDVGVLSKYPQLLQVQTPDRILITDDIANTKNGKVVGIQQFSASDEISEPIKRLRVNDSFVERIGLDRSNITDRAIASYLYAEKTNLIYVVFVTLNPDAKKRAVQVGLRAELV